MTTTVKQAKSIPYLYSASLWGEKVNKFVQSVFVNLGSNAPFTWSQIQYCKGRVRLIWEPWQPGFSTGLVQFLGIDQVCS